MMKSTETQELQVSRPKATTAAEKKPAISAVCFSVLFFSVRISSPFLNRLRPFRTPAVAASWLPLLCRRVYTMQELQQKLKAMQTRWDFDKSQLIVDHDDGLKGIMHRSVLGEPTPITFEGKTFMGVEHPHEYLRKKYGDYMTLPGDDKKRQHDFHLLNLNKSYRDV